MYMRHMGNLNMFVQNLTVIAKQFLMSFSIVRMLVHVNCIGKQKYTISQQ